MLSTDTFCTFYLLKTCIGCTGFFTTLTCAVIWLDPPCRTRCGFGPSLGAALPDAVGHVVSDGSQHLCELSRPVVQVQRAHTGQVSPQVSVDAWALDADQRTQIETGPGGICRMGEERLLSKNKPWASGCTTTVCAWCELCSRVNVQLCQHLGTHSVLRSPHTDCCLWHFGWPAALRPRSDCSSAPARTPICIIYSYPHKCFCFINKWCLKSNRYLSKHNE